VPSGEEALRVANQRQLDLVLMDIQLAGEMDGIEAAELIWQDFGVPVVYLTGEDDEETMSRASLTGAYGWVHKPFQKRDLSTAIRMALSKHETESVLQEKYKWLETTLQSIPDAVTTVDSVGCVKFINPAAQALTGWTCQEAVGRDVLEVLRVLDHDTRWPSDAVTKIIQNDISSVDSRKRILLDRNGAETIVEEIATPIVNDQREIIGVALVFRSKELKCQ
jgi:PAS domain S-box-containing protein